MLSLLMCTRRASHVTRVVTWITAVNRDAVRHNMLLLLHTIARSNSGRFLLIWNQYFFPVQLGCYGYGSHLVVVPALRVKMTFMRIQNDIHVEMALILTHSSANQISVFSITQHSR